MHIKLNIDASQRCGLHAQLHFPLAAFDLSDQALRSSLTHLVRHLLELLCAVVGLRLGVTCIAAVSGACRAGRHGAR